MRRSQSYTPENLATIHAALTAAGVTGKIGSWDGGEDSGSINVDHADLSGEINELIQEIVEDVLDYGSFAGEYETSGDILYESDTATIVCDGMDASHCDSSCVSHPVTFDVPDIARIQSIDILDRIHESDYARFVVEPPPLLVNLSNGPTPDWVPDLTEWLRYELHETVESAAASEFEGDSIDFCVFEVEIIAATAERSAHIRLRKDMHTYSTDSVYHEIELLEPAEEEIAK